MDCWQLGLKPIRNLGVVEYNVFQSRPTPTVRQLGHVSSCSLPSSVEDCFQGSLTLCLGLPHAWVSMPHKAYRWRTAGTCWRQPAVQWNCENQQKWVGGQTESFMGVTDVRIPFSTAVAFKFLGSNYKLSNTNLTFRTRGFDF